MRIGIRTYSWVGIFLLSWLFCLTANTGNLSAQATTEAAAEKAKMEPLLSMEIGARFLPPPSEGISRNDREAIAAWRQQKRQVDERIRNLQSQVSEMMKGGGQVNVGDFNAWFEEYIIPKMAQTDERTLSLLGNARKDFFKRYVTQASNPAARNQVMNLVIPKMKEIAENNYHPACRTNAVIVLSELNAREGIRSRSLPVPNPTILPYLRNIVTSADSAETPAFLNVPALAGIKRHAQCRVPNSDSPFSDQELRGITSEMTALLAEEATSEADRDRIAWQKRQAIQILGFLNSPGEGGSTAKLLRDLILNDDADSGLRRDAIISYGMLNFTGQPEAAEVMTVALKIGELVAQDAESESDYIENKINDIKVTVRFLDGGDAESSGGGEKDSRGSVGLGQGADSGPGNNSSIKNDIPEVLPKYHRDIVRRRVQYSTWTGRYTLVGDARAIPPVKGLKDYVAQDSEEARLIQKLVSDLDSLLVTTDIQEDVEEEEDEDEDDDKDDEEEEVRTKSYADLMKDALKAGAARIERTLDEFRPEEMKDEMKGEMKKDMAEEGAAGAGQQ